MNSMISQKKELSLQTYFFENLGTTGFDSKISWNI